MCYLIIELIFRIDASYSVFDVCSDLQHHFCVVGSFDYVLGG